MCHGSWVPGPILTVSCLYACAYVWAGVCGCVWLRLIRSSWESSPLGYISSCHALPLVRSLQCLRSSFTVRSGSAIPEPCCFLDSPLPYGKLRFCLRKAPPLPYGKLRFCLRKAPPLPTKSSTLVSRCVLLLVINSLFRNWILPSSLWQNVRVSWKINYGPKTLMVFRNIQ